MKNCACRKFKFCLSNCEKHVAELLLNLLLKLMSVTVNLNGLDFREMSDVSNSNWQKYFGWVKNVHAANSSYAPAIVSNILSFSNWLLEFLFVTTSFKMCIVVCKCFKLAKRSQKFHSHRLNFHAFVLIFSTCKIESDGL